MLAMTLESLSLFWAKVDKSGECWTWTGARDPRGYGRLGRGRKTLFAHRFSWEEENGPIPNGLFVCHSCDNPACVRPSHLFLGTQKDNIRDMMSKNRGALPPGAMERRNLTHCCRGHAFDAKNTRIYRGARMCRQCNRDRKTAQRRARNIPTRRAA